jgi:transposase, IS5 family
MEEALHDVPAFRDFAGLSHWDEYIPSESSILRFRHHLERHKLADQILATVNALLQAKGLQLKAGTVVDATLIAAPTSTKNQSGERDPEMHQSKKGNQWYFGMKAHIGVDADSGLVHTVRGTSGNVGDVIEANSLLHGQKINAFGDAGYQGVDKRPDAKPGVRWHVALRPGLRRALDKDKPVDALIDQLERTKASIRAKVEHPFRVIKQQFGYVRVRYRGLKKNTAQIVTLFALGNLWMARHKLLTCMGQARDATGSGANSPGPSSRGSLHVRNFRTDPQCLPRQLKLKEKPRLFSLGTRRKEQGHADRNQRYGPPDSQELSQADADEPQIGEQKKHAQHHQYDCSNIALHVTSL